MKTVSIILIIAALSQAALSGAPATVSNAELIAMNATQLVEYCLKHITHDVDYKVPEVVDLAKQFMEEIHHLIGTIDAKEESKIKNLLDLIHTVEEYVKVVREDTKTCGLRNIIWGKLRDTTQFVNREDDELFSAWAKFEGRTYLAILDDVKPHQLIARKVRAILEEDEALEKQVDEMVTEIASKCKSVEYKLPQYLHQQLGKFF